MGRNGSDKGNIDIVNSWHNYTIFYYCLFQSLRQQNLRIFELGLGTNNINIKSNMGINGVPCASLYGWSEFFPNAQIFGADIDKDILINNDKFTTFFCDQTNPAVIQTLWKEPALQEDFDIIIEDGLHEVSANICFFENSIHKLKPNGYFIIEDISNANQQLFQNQIENWKQKYENCVFQLIQLESYVNTYDNNLLVVWKTK
jgi:SAM-dependent methyltransferase